MVATLTVFDDGNRIERELVVVLQGAAHQLMSLGGRERRHFF
jgi:hypothetical protein